MLYSNGWFDGCETPEQYAEAARATVDVGHTAIKLDPFKRGAAYLAGYAANYPPDEDYAAVDIIEAIRTEIGNNIEIFIDAHGRFNLPTAVRLANRLRPYRIGWFEEPVPPENWDALKQFRDQTDVPICVGERLYTRWQFRPVLEQKLTDYIMPDIIRTGGISEMKKIATLAETFFVPISPHDATGPITLIAGAQTMMSTSSFFRLEIAYSELEELPGDHGPAVRRPRRLLPRLGARPASATSRAPTTWSSRSRTDATAKCLARAVWTVRARLRHLGLRRP